MNQPAAAGAPRRRRRAGRRALLAVLLLVGAAVVAEFALRWTTVAVQPLLVERVPGRLSMSDAYPNFTRVDLPTVGDRPRILWLGASTEAGVPFGDDDAPANWLQRVLQARGASVECVAVGCPGLSAGETRDVFPDLLRLHPAAIIVGAGHNEYTRTSGLLGGWWERSRLFVRLRALFVPRRIEDRTPTPSEHFDDEAIVDAFRDALTTIQAQAEAAAVPLFVTVPISNLADCPPILGDAGHLPESPDDAFLRGRAAQADGRRDEARAAFVQARDTDRWPHRATTALIDVVLHDMHHPIRADLAIDAAANGLPGDDFFIDHCHPVPAGSRVLVIAVADALEDAGVIPPTGHRGEAPPLEELAAAVHVSPLYVVRQRADCGLVYGCLALLTGRAGQLSAAADARLAAAPPGFGLPGEVQTLRGLLALLAGDKAAARALLLKVRQHAPAMLAMVNQASSNLPWVRAVFERNGVTLQSLLAAKGP